jgi:hypothetical protein
MLKKIKTSELRVGMFVTELCGSWIDTPFWKKSFLLSDSAELLESEIKDTGSVDRHKQRP